MAVVDRITRAAYEKLKQEYEELRQCFVIEQQLRERTEAEVGRLAPIVREVLNAHLGSLVRELTAVQREVERMGCSMSEQLNQLNSTLDEVVSRFGTLTQTIQNESAQLTALLERLNQQTQIDLSPAIRKAEEIRNAVETANASIQSLVADEPAPNPEPEPNPNPEPLPGRGR
jgi:chromosome segregation ATPase